MRSFSPGQLAAGVASMLLVAAFDASSASAQKPVMVWLTNADASVQLQPQPALSWRKAGDAETGIAIDDSVTYQTMLGFGHALTGGSAQLLMKMSAPARKALLTELFGNGPGDIHTSYLRVTVGASDMNDHVYTYDDLAAGTTDPELEHFSLAEDEKDVIPVLKEILAIEPSLQILASPWTAPAWMKTNNDFKGGELKPEYYKTYAHYWVLYLQGMHAHGIDIAALTPQNEPENPANTPSMVMTAPQEANFIGTYLGPALAAAGLKTTIIDFDHNCDHPIYTETILSDPAAARYVDGSGFHLYYGEITALTEVHNKFPNKNIYFTEQTVVPSHDPAKKSIAGPVANLMIGAPANWSRNVLLWNLAADPSAGPHTSNGGCPGCTGAITLDGDRVTRLPAYYTAAHASKFVPPGSIRIGSTAPANSVAHVAYRTPSGGHALLLSNTGTNEQSVHVLYRHQSAEIVLAAGAVATCVW